MARISFEEWLKKIDEIIIAKLGLSYEDLPDCPYSSWYDEGMSAATAARKAIKYASE